MEAIISWITSLANRSFPILALTGTSILLGFNWIAPSISPLLSSDKLYAYSTLAVIVGIAGTLVVNAQAIWRQLAKLMRSYSRRSKFKKLPLEAKLAVTILLTLNLNEIAVPRKSNAHHALLDSDYAYIKGQSDDFVVLSFPIDTIRELRSHRAKFEKIYNLDPALTSEFVEKIKAAEDSKRKYNETAWMKL